MEVAEGEGGEPVRERDHNSPRCAAGTIEAGARVASRSIIPLFVAVTGLVCLIVPMAATAWAQHETSADIEDGARVFRENCATCHGPDGNALPGMDFGRGQFRQAYSDADLARIIREGIPGTAMPPGNFPEEQAARVVAYLRSVAASHRSSEVTGDAHRGRAIFEGKGACLNCHRVDGAGFGLGPELTSIGQSRRAIELEQSLLEPQAEVLPWHRFYRVVTSDGTALTGRLLNLDTFTVQLLDSSGRLRSFAKADLQEYDFAPSPMPSYRDTLTAQEVADVVSYLVSLKGRGVQ